MKNYTITVNGNVYDVTVEEGTGSAAPAAKAAALKQLQRLHLRQQHQQVLREQLKLTLQCQERFLRLMQQQVLL